jgi:peroxiredoxin/CheY-like chemotaxis protein
MLRHRLPLLLLLLALCPAVNAQRTLADVQRQFAAAVQRLGPRPTREQQEELRRSLIPQLRTFLDQEAKGDDRWNGRLMLADFQLSLGDGKEAAATLRSIDAGEAPALVLLTGATMAQHVGLTEQRDAWVAAAVGKPAPLPDRLAMARLLLGVLHEPARSEELFAAALAAAGSDEEKALVRWHRADAMRDIEDPAKENLPFEELEKLAAELPGTYWGGVAKDRLRATRLRVGDEAIAFRAKTRDGAEIGSQGLLGKTVVLVFWSASDQDTPRLLTLLGQLRTRCGGKLAVVGVSLDRSDEAIGAAVKSLGIDFPVVGDGKGIETDVALRWFVEGPVVHVVDARGKVAGLGLHVGTTAGRTELVDLVERCCAN